MLFPLKRGTFFSSGFSCFGSTVTNCCFGKLFYLIIYFESSEIFYCKFFIFHFKFFYQRCKLWVLNCCLSFEHFESCHQGKYSRKPSCRRLRVNLLAAKLKMTWLTKKRNFEQGILKGEVSLYYWPPVWLIWNRMRTEIFCFYLQNRLIQTSQTGGQWYSDTSFLVFPVLSLWHHSLHGLWLNVFYFEFEKHLKSQNWPGYGASFLQKNDKNNFVSFFWSVSLNAIWMKLCLMSI